MMRSCGYLINLPGATCKIIISDKHDRWVDLLIAVPAEESRKVGRCRSQILLRRSKGEVQFVNLSDILRHEIQHHHSPNIFNKHANKLSKRRVLL